MSGLILGGTGQMGRALSELLPGAVVWSRMDADFLTPEAWLDNLEKLRPDWVINACAYTAVDLAESPTEFERALTVNATTPVKIAQRCAKLSIPFVHYSTDYVYSDASNPDRRPWVESDLTAPLNAYGRTKLAGDEDIAKIRGKWLIFRTSWVFAPNGKNFVNTMLRLGATQPEVRVVADQVGAPSYAPDLAVATVEALEKASNAKSFPSGIYHLCNSGQTTWAEFAREIFRQSGHNCRVVDLATADYPTPARRPLNSQLSLNKTQEVFGIHLPLWQDALARCLSAHQDTKKTEPPTQVAQ